jgi:hypothetical protein
MGFLTQYKRVSWFGSAWTPFCRSWLSFYSDYTDGPGDGPGRLTLSINMTSLRVDGVKGVTQHDLNGDFGEENYPASRLHCAASLN